MRIAVLGVDLGKNVCSLVGLNASGAVVLRRRAKRETMIALAAKLSPCIVGMEACCGAHHLGRVFAAYGHDVRLIWPCSSGPLSIIGWVHSSWWLSPLAAPYGHKPPALP